MTSNEFDAILSEYLDRVNVLINKHYKLAPIQTLRAGSDSRIPFPLKFCDPNMMVFHPRVSKIWAGTEQNGNSFTTLLASMHLN